MHLGGIGSLTDRARQLAAAILTGTVMVAAGTLGNPSALADPGRHFTGGPLPPAPTSGLQRNGDVEPGMAVTPDGVFWIASTINGDPRSGTGGVIAPKDDPLFSSSGTDIWRSTDGGGSYQWVAAPFNPVSHRPGLGGGDSDITVASDRNASGNYNVYATSLWTVGTGVASTVYVGDISVAVSQDNGRTWLTDVLAADVPMDDRPWVAADGACTLYLTYHAGPTLLLVVNRYDLCNPVRTATGLTLVPVASSRQAPTLVPLLTGKPGTYVLGDVTKPAVDTSPRSHYHHNIYLPAMDCPGLTPMQEVNRALHSPDCPNGNAKVFVLRSRDEGSTWSLIPVVSSTNNLVRTWQVWAATDAAGNVYLAWSNTRNVYLNVSHDGGSTWGTPRLVSHSPSRTSVFPTIAAGGVGKVELAWYGAPVAGLSDDATVFGQPGAPNAVPWSVFSARSTDGGINFDLVQVTGRVHTGKVCTLGGGCNFFSGERNLLDDFGIAISPTTGRSSIAYTSDQPEGDVLHDFTGFATQAAR
jgi:hypothetical protein